MEEAQVKVQRISSVVPAIPTERHPMSLSNLDLLWLPFNNVQRLLFYTISHEDHYSAIVERLEKSLSSVLVHFYPLAGRLDMADSGRVEIDCNDAGLEFVEASIDMPFSSLQRDGFHYKPFFQNLVQHAHPLQGHNFSRPFLSVQVTRFEGEGISIGTTLHHIIADGNSFWNFMKSWAEISRGLPLSNPPVHARKPSNPQNKKPKSISYKPHEIEINGIRGAQIYKFLPDDLQGEEDKTEETQKPLELWLGQKTQVVYSTFCFTRDKIRGLKKESGAVSSFVAVAAHFWTSVVISSQVADEDDVVFVLLADCRGRVKPPLPSSYFGNFVSVGAVRTTAKTLLSNSLCFAAGLIQEAINSCTSETQINNMIDWLDSPNNGGLRLLEELGGVYCTNVVSSHRFPVYEIDHGWGRPLNVQAASMNENGVMVLFAANANDGGGSIVVSTCLPQDRMDTLTRLLSVSH